MNNKESLETVKVKSMEEINMRKKLFVKKYAKAVSEGYAAVFAGAGTSVGAGFVDWRKLIEPFASELELNIDKESDLVRVIQYYYNQKRNRSEINEKIVNAFSSKENISETMNILTKLPISTYWTTNYDRLIEAGLESNNRKADVKIKQENLAFNQYDRDAVVYKMHGDVSSPNEAVITKDDYEMYNENHSLFTTALRGDLVTKTFLFVGFSFEDPNLDYILGKIKILLGDNTREHFCFLEKIKEKNYQVKGSTNIEEFTNDKLKQELRIEDLKRYGIQTVLLDSYSEIPEILYEVEKVYLNKTVFISGSISEYDSVWDKNSVTNFCYNLAKKIVNQDYKIISGFGIDIGSNIINGALDEIYTNKYKHINEHLSLHPFPQIQSGDETLKGRWTQLRKEMISEAGVCVFIFGNKIDKDTGNVMIANGMLEEFEIAKEMNKIIIPVSGTGYAAKEIFNLLLSDKQNYIYLDKFWDRLESENSNDLIETILDIFNILRN